MTRAAVLTAVTVVLMTVLSIARAQAKDDAPLLRLGAGAGFLYVVPDESSPVIGAKVENTELPTVSLYIFPGEGLVDAVKWAKYFRVSTELGVTKHAVSVNGATVGHVSTIPLNANLEFHPFPDGWNRFDPFVGAGANLTYFTKQKEGLGDFQALGPEVGALFLAGVDYWITKNLFAEVRVRKFFIETDLTPRATGQKVETLQLDPWTFGFTVGYRF